MERKTKLAYEDADRLMLAVRVGFGFGLIKKKTLLKRLKKEKKITELSP